MAAIKCWKCGKQHDVNKYHSTAPSVRRIDYVPHLKFLHTQEVEDLRQLAEQEFGREITTHEIETHLELIKQQLDRKSFDKTDQKKRKQQRQQRKKSQRTNREKKKKKR